MKIIDGDAAPIGDFDQVTCRRCLTRDGVESSEFFVSIVAPHVVYTSTISAEHSVKRLVCVNCLAAGEVVRARTN